jgi:hypothetical protein
MAQAVSSNVSPAARQQVPDRITTPAGSTIEPVDGGGYRVCDASSHCLRAGSLWEAQQLIQWAEVHHQPLDPDLDRNGFRS